MPSNPYTEQKRCNEHIETVMTRVLPKVGELIYSHLIRDCLIRYAVSRRSVEAFIKDFYVDTGLVEIRDGYLVIKKEVLVHESADAKANDQA